MEKNWKDELREIADRVGIEAVRSETLKILRRDALGAAALKMRAMPYEFSASTREALRGREN